MSVSVNHFQSAKTFAECGQLCLNEILSASGQTNDLQSELQKIIVEADHLIALSEQADRIEKILANRPLSSAHCKDARRKADKALENYPSSYANWWLTAKNQARVQLQLQVKDVEKKSPPAELPGQGQVARAIALLDNVDPWLGMLVLDSDDHEADRKLFDLIYHTWRELDNLANQRIDDFAAGNTVLDGKISKERILDIQIGIDQSLYEKFQNLCGTLEICAEHNSDKYDRYLLSAQQKTDNLETWLNRLLNFQRSINTIKFMAVEKILKFGRPQQINEILAHHDSIVASRIGADSMGKGLEKFGSHPTFLWLRDEYVANLTKRRDNEEVRRDRFEWAVELQHITTEELLNDWIDARPEVKALMNSTDLSPYTSFLREVLQVIDHVSPLEMAFDILGEMRHVEPEDETQLQLTLKYKDPHRPGSELRSLSDIYKALQPVVEQIRVARQWLSQFQALPGPSTETRECPGVVNWESERREICQLLQKGDVNKALQNCQGIGDVNEASLYNNLWPLPRAIRALQTPPKSLLNPLSEPARNLEQGRQKRLAYFEAQLQECSQLEEHIQDVRRQVDQAWNDLKVALEGVETSNLINRAASRNKLRLAADRYHSLCPKNERWLKLQQDHREIQYSWRPDPNPQPDEWCG